MRKRQDGLGFFVFFLIAIIVITHITNDVLNLPWYSAAIVAGALGAVAYYIWASIVKYLKK